MNEFNSTLVAAVTCNHLKGHLNNGMQILEIMSVLLSLTSKIHAYLSKIIFSTAFHAQHFLKYFLIPMKLGGSC